MSALKSVKGFCVAILCLISAVFLGTAGSASAAKTLLFLPFNEAFPYHLTGLTVTEGAILETVGGQKFTATALHTLVLVLNRTLFHVHILFLGTKAEKISPCSNLGGTPSSGVVLIELLGHFELLDVGVAPFLRPGVLLLVPNGFSFECELLGVKSKISVLGSVIGLIKHPPTQTASKLLGVVFEQSKGVQNHTSVLLPNGVVLSDVLLDSALNGGAYEQTGAGLPESLLLALTGQETFSLIAE